EVGTATMMYAKGAIKPVQQMSEEAGNPIDPKEFIGAVAGYYSSADGKLVSMPFNSSTVVFYYNKDAFKKAGLDADNPPKTWEELGRSRPEAEGRGPGMPATPRREVGTATMMYAKGAIKPVQQMSEEAGNPIDPKE
ncbi:hypothetical protein CTI14_42035, partial [Methylobacterium radiotolerans]